MVAGKVESARELPQWVLDTRGAGHIFLGNFEQNADAIQVHTLSAARRLIAGCLPHTTTEF